MKRANSQPKWNTSNVTFASVGEHCYSCHSSEAKNVEAELLTDTANGLSTGGSNRSCAATGKPEQSLIIKALKHTDLQMPPTNDYRMKSSAQVRAMDQRKVPLIRERK